MPAKTQISTFSIKFSKAQSQTNSQNVQDAIQNYLVHEENHENLNLHEKRQSTDINGKMAQMNTLKTTVKIESAGK